MAKTAAGALDRSITIERFDETAMNEFNEQVGAWADFKTVRAKRRDVSDNQRNEMIAAGQLGAFIASRFTVRSSSETRTITPKDRLTHDGSTWSIKAVKEANEGRFRFLEILAVKDADI